MLNNGALGSLAFQFRTFVRSMSNPRKRRAWRVSRKSRLFAILAGLFLIVVAFPRYFLPSTRAPKYFNAVDRIQNNCPNRPPSKPYQPLFPPKFSWRYDLPPEKYPVTKPLHLPVPSLKTNIPRVQKYPYPSESQAATQLRLSRLQQIKKTFLRSWNSYKKHAWLQDELLPISGQGKDVNLFGDGWAATLVDNLDTLLIMDLTAEFAEAVDAVLENVHFGPPPKRSFQISTFEMTIRHLGGLLSAYDLSGCMIPGLLDKAIEIGDMLMRSFDNASRMPITRWDMHKAAAYAEAVRDGDEVQQEMENQDASVNAILAEFASFGPEMTRLAQLSGDDRYYDAVARIQQAMKTQQNETRIPGLWPIAINARFPDLAIGHRFGLGAMSDSAYEYLIKMHTLLGGDASTDGKDYGKMHEKFVDAAVDNGMFFRPVAPGAPDVLFPGNLVATSGHAVRERVPREKSADTTQHLTNSESHTNQLGLPRLEPQGAHLACFAGGMLLLGGRILSRPEDVKVGIKLTEGCVWAYNSSAFGIMPERFTLKPCDANYKEQNGGSCDLNNVLWEKEFAGHSSNKEVIPKGFARIDERGYFLRPEALESVFYAYRVTGDDKYREMAWQMFESIEKYTATEYGNAAIPDVTVPAHEELGPGKSDSMESFWLAETLKYLYLIFSEPDVVNLDEWVLNTEAHPFRRP